MKSQCCCLGRDWLPLTMTWLRSTWEKSSVLKSEKEGVSLFISMINESINQSLSLTCMCACVHTCMGTCTHSFRLYMKPEQIWSQQRWESGQEGRVQKVPEGQLWDRVVFLYGVLGVRQTQVFNKSPNLSGQVIPTSCRKGKKQCMKSR